MAYAVFCFEHGGQEYAKAFLDTALEMWPRLEPMAKQLLPTLMQTGF